MMARCISLDKDCADICIQSARLLARDSEIRSSILVDIEKICRMWAAECVKHEHEHCKQCAQACKDCADAFHAHQILRYRRIKNQQFFQFGVSCYAICFN